MLSFSQEDEARKVRSDGNRIIYVVVGANSHEYESRKNKINDMAGGSHNVIYAGGFDHNPGLAILMYEM
ncbi:hypothetical protein COOONC_13583 [Cooperia oncophora]